MRSELQRRLSRYWRMELANAVIVPFALLLLAEVSGDGVGWLSVAALVPMVGLLIVGGWYWRAKWLQLGGDRRAIEPALRLADRAQRPLGVTSIAAAGLAALSWVVPALSVGRSDRIVASIAAALAAAEYVNYYHRQLQHVDRLADARRLVSGRGFRPAKLAVDLARHRTGGTTSTATSAERRLRCVDGPAGQAPDPPDAGQGRRGHPRS
ncbi:MAG: hypothetical protein AAGA93_03600 [Actinomycetota bacterium]